MTEDIVKVLTEEDVRRIAREVAQEEIVRLLTVQKQIDDNVKKRLGIARKMDNMF